MHSIAIAGMGKMGANMALRLISKKINPVVWNRDPLKATALEARGAQAAATLTELVAKLKPPRAVWMMVPAGAPTEDLFLRLMSLLEKGDLVIDGANGHWREAVRHAEEAGKRGVGFLDAGVSGGVWGLANGYCIMSGGANETAAHAEPFMKAMCQEGGYLHCGPAGAGHYVKMVHNAIEYAMMAAYGEGFELLKASPFGAVDPSLVASLWNHGSVVRSWLLELAQNAFDKDPGLDKISGVVPDSGEGRWAVEEAARLGVPLPGISTALFNRFRSQDKNNFGDRLSAALRHEFGGHALQEKKKA